MKLDTISKKIMLSVLVAFGGVFWLNTWHHLGGRGALISAPLGYWLRDSIFILAPLFPGCLAGFLVESKTAHQVHAGNINSGTLVGFSCHTGSLHNPRIRSGGKYSRPADWDRI